MHRDFIHFKLNFKDEPDNVVDTEPEYFEMNFSNPNHIKLFQESAVATGAFPGKNAFAKPFHLQKQNKFLNWHIQEFGKWRSHLKG